jgi:hypothetical protein
MLHAIAHAHRVQLERVAAGCRRHQLLGAAYHNSPDPDRAAAVECAVQPAVGVLAPVLDTGDVGMVVLHRVHLCQATSSRARDCDSAALGRRSGLLPAKG